MEIINSDKAAEMDSATVAAWQEQAEGIPVLRAQVLADAGRFEEAATAFRGIVAKDPTDVMAQKNLAAILTEMGNSADAFEVYETIMTLPNLNSRDYYAIGVGFYQGSDYPRASAAFGHAAESSVRDRDALEMWTRSLQLDSAYAEIPPVAERWIELDPNSQNGLLIYAQAANQNGDEDMAREMIGRIEALPVTMSDLQITRFDSGGAQVSGSVSNKTLDAGTSIAITFTFYTDAGDPLGTVTETVNVGAEGMSEVFRVEFSSAETVGGYSYEVSVG